MNQKATPDKKSTQPKRPRCKACGYRIRGANHESGSHHKGKRLAQWTVDTAMRVALAR